MHDGDGQREARLKARDQLRRERDFRDEDERLLAAGKHASDELQIDFRFAAARDAVQKMRRERPEGSLDAVDCLSLRLIQHGAGSRRDVLPLALIHSRNAFDKAALAELLERLHRASRRCEQRLRVCGRMLDEIADDRAQPRGSCRNLRQGVQSTELGQAPFESFFAQGRTLSECDRQGRREDLADRMAIVIGRPSQKLQQRVVERRFAIEHRLDRPNLCCGYVRTIPTLEDDADDLAPAEGNAHPNAWFGQALEVGRNAIVERPAQGGVDRDGKVHGRG